MGWAPLRSPDWGGQNSGPEFWCEFSEKFVWGAGGVVKLPRTKTKSAEGKTHWWPDRCNCGLSGAISVIDTPFGSPQTAILPKGY
jgi:hypothetical protein